MPLETSDSIGSARTNKPRTQKHLKMCKATGTYYHHDRLYNSEHIQEDRGCYMWMKSMGFVTHVGGRE